MKHIPFYSIPAVLFIMCCGLFLSFYPDKVAAQLALHHAWYSPSGYWWMEVITSWGEAHLFVIVIIAVILQKRYLMAFEFLSAGIVSSIVVQSFKRLVFAPSPRPMAVIKWSETLLPEGLEVPLQFAFPSGHTTTAFVFFTLLALHFKKISVQILAVIAVIGVGLSRVYLMAHWIPDVMAGGVLGLVIALLVNRAFLAIKKSRPSLR
ncbi:MAG: phosphatase PAP2 family protein [Schleiferiaceae bacterium]|jgi:membrane-associated phospholipid phosphatase|nr:phosphatase PAP2 family protein [Schleiferiaceae bacterium]MDP4758927.1 phosphatase PAP2 family protein [Schleiferiaceae bacterium]MDP4767013.1 phosphatase PAP2 family protein [Schleiferiaceae bacterium]MDP4959011.1 phosphatase PAP2 family protein [Schleiferiaceae bacterium]